MRRRLARAGFDGARIQAVLERLRGAGYVDDAAFARYWVEQRQSFRPRGARLLQAELRQRGIRAPLPTELDPEADAYRAGHKRARQLAAADERTFKIKLGQLLARRGFDWQTIATTVDRLWQELSTSSDSAPAPTA